MKEILGDIGTQNSTLYEDNNGVLNLEKYPKMTKKNLNILGLNIIILGIILSKEVDIFLKELNLIGKEKIFLIKDWLSYHLKGLGRFLWYGKSIQKRGIVTIYVRIWDINVYLYQFCRVSIESGTYIMFVRW